MKKALCLLALVNIFHLIFAQQNDQDDNNVVISRSTREFRFVAGNSEHPVQVKEESSRTYTCKSYRTEVQVAEFYSDHETIDDVNILVNGSKKHGITPRNNYYSVNGIFYSDARVSYFELPLSKIGATAEVTFRKTTLDPRYFTNIFFNESELIENQEIRLVVPSWMQIDIKEYNFKKYSVKKEVTKNGDETIYTYRMSDLPRTPRERSAPGMTYYAPHILVMCKSARPKGETYTYFKTLKEQYGWYRHLVEQIGDDEKLIKEKTLEITAGLSSDEEKVKKIFQWVQDNIRYIAFENGIAGFKPEKSQEVLRKKYGDCKGMANLLTIMLRSINLDARRCWIGTRHIAYDYSTPSLSVDNHMICAWMYKGKPIFLDATEKYIGFGEIAERLQGRQVLIENGTEFTLDRVPEASPMQNTAMETRRFTIDGNSLKGHVVQIWKGENKEWLLTALNSIKQDRQENVLKQFLAEGKQNFQIQNLEITNLSDYNADLRIEYDVTWIDVVTVFDKEIYLDIDNRRSFQNSWIDTVKRKLPYWFDFKNNLVFETEIQLPADKAVNTLPASLDIKQPGYKFTASYSSMPGKILYKNEIVLNHTELKPENFSQWNRDIQQLSNFYDQQIVLTTK